MKRGVPMTVCSILLALSGLFSAITAYVLVTDLSSMYLSLILAPEFLYPLFNSFYTSFLSEALIFVPILLGVTAILLTVVNLWNTHVSKKLRAALTAVFVGAVLFTLVPAVFAHAHENSMLLRVCAVLCLPCLAVYAVLVVINAVQTVAD